MEILKLEYKFVTDIIESIALILLITLIISVIFKMKINMFEKYLSMFKFVFYLLLAILTFILNVTLEGENISVNYGVPEELTIGQSLLILLSLLEALSNVVTFFQMPKSENHLIDREEFNRYRSKDFYTHIEMKKRIGDLERALEVYKNSNNDVTANIRKKRRGKKRRKGKYRSF